MSDTISYPASEAIPYGAVVVLDGDTNELELAGGPDETPFGIALADTAKDELCPVARQGQKVYTLVSGDIEAGDCVVVDEDGKVRAFKPADTDGEDPGVYWIVGTADYANSASDGLVRVNIDRTIAYVFPGTD